MGRPRAAGASLPLVYSALRNCNVSSQVEDLKRFIKMVHICPPGKQAAGVGSPNVGVARSLAHLFEDQAAAHAR